MDSLSYSVAWVLYLVCALGLVLIFWRMTRNLQLRRTRRVLRALVVALLFTPINIVADGMWLAPAYLVATYEGVQGNIDQAVEASMYLVVAFVLMIVVILCASVTRRLLAAGRA